MVLEVEHMPSKADNLNQQTLFFAILPEEEISFLSENSAEIIRNSDMTLEGMLAGIVNVFSGREYGWEEAILSGLWYQYPHEMKEQRFCSEEALKNFLLARFLQIPAQYCVLENYNNRGVGHECVLVPHEGKTYLLDYDKVLEVEVEENKFVHHIPVSGKLENAEFSKLLQEISTYKITFDSIEYLNEEEVLNRVESLRSGDSLLNALECGQELYKRAFRYGELQAQVKYFPDEATLEFTYFLSSVSLMSPLYFTSRIKAISDGVSQEDEIGISPKAFNESEIERIPVVTFVRGGEQKIPTLHDFIEKLSPNDQFNVYSEMLYSTFIDEDHSEEIKEDCTVENGEIFMYSKEIRDTFASFIESLVDIKNFDIEKIDLETLGDSFKINEAYQHAKKTSPVLEAAFLDYHNFRSELYNVGIKGLDELKGCVDQMITKPFNDPNKLYWIDCFKRFSTGLAVGKAQQARQMLVQALAERTGLPYHESKDADFLGILQVVAEDD
jgi:hypothetical protein